MQDEQLQAKLEARIANLRNRIAAASRNSHSAQQAAATPRKSHSAQQAAAALDRLECDPNLSTAEKLAAVVEVDRQLTLDLKSGIDVTLYGPNLGRK